MENESRPAGLHEGVWLSENMTVWRRETRGLTLAQREVLRVLYGFCRPDQRGHLYCFPMIETIADAAALDESTVDRALAKLREHTSGQTQPFLTVERFRFRRSGRTRNLYWLRDMVEVGLRKLLRPRAIELIKEREADKFAVLTFPNEAPADLLPAFASLEDVRAYLVRIQPDPNQVRSCLEEIQGEYSRVCDRNVGISGSERRRVLRRIAGESLDIRGLLSNSTVLLSARSSLDPMPDLALVQ